jgi:hypothetical protein
MQKQNDLFNDAYDDFEASLPENYPKFKFRPLHPSFTRKALVTSGTNNKRQYLVDLSIGECVCPKGFAYGYDDRRKRDPWYDASYCGHKLKLMSRICETSELTGDAKREQMQGYLKALGTKYNPFEAVSAFHKELRRGDFKQAWFWGLILTTKRGIHGLFQYMLNIVYEETRDHDLAEFLLKCRTSDRMLTLSYASKAISWFCASIKKWQIPRRYAIFESEMHGYKLLVKEYGTDVAKGGNIIPTAHKAKLVKAMRDGAKANDLVQFQRGLKGLQKLKYFDGDDRDGYELKKHRFWLYETLYELGEEMHGDDHDMWRVVQYVNARHEAGHGIGYHELNAIADALTGEPADAGTLPATDLKRALARPQPPIPLYIWPPIPLYAQDNHTYGGKALIRRFPDQLKPSANQSDLDFRYCGAYFGVAYRMVSQKQHGNVNDIAWHDVKWPMPLYNIVMSLWY